MQPYTEAANKITADIDISKPDEIVEKLKQCDVEMFQPSGLAESIQVSKAFTSYELRYITRQKSPLIVSCFCYFMLRMICILY